MIWTFIRGKSHIFTTLNGITHHFSPHATNSALCIDTNISFYTCPFFLEFTHVCACACALVCICMHVDVPVSMALAFCDTHCGTDSPRNSEKPVINRFLGICRSIIWRFSIPTAVIIPAKHTFDIIWLTDQSIDRSFYLFIILDQQIVLTTSIIL